MRAPPIAEILAAWERAYAQHPAARAVTLLVAAGREDAAALGVDERDARLLALREAMFGTTLDAHATCDACGEKMEMRLATSDVRPPPAAAPPRDLEVGDYRVAWRAPTAGDLAALAPSRGAEAARAELEERCVIEARRAGAAIAARDLPTTVRDALASAIAEAAPGADVELAMPCPACGREAAVPFDVATYFWDELHAWATRTLRAVHALARAYGWAEHDILAMTPFRRQLYLEMLGE